MSRKKAAAPAVKPRRWTAEEETYLMEKWGDTSIKGLAKALGRTETAIIVRAQRLQLGAHLAADHRVSVNQVMLAVHGGKPQGSYTLDIWMRAGFPIKRHKVKNCTFKVIDLNDFWKWAERHKNILNFARMEENALGAEPDWAKEKRRIDIRERFITFPWTPAEDAILKSMLAQYRYTYDDISRELSRSEGAIKRRICDLRLPQRPVRRENRPWTGVEVQFLLQSMEAGHCFEQIGEELGRSALAVRGKYERLQNPDYMKRYFRRQREDMRRFFQTEMCLHYVKTIGCTAGGTNCDGCELYARRDPGEPHPTGWNAISARPPEYLQNS